MPPAQLGADMKRRDFLAGAISVAAGSRVSAQGLSRRLAICSLGESSSLMRERSDNRYYGVLFDELRRLGHVEGKNLVVGRYGTEQATSGPAALAAEVVRSAPDVIYLIGPGAPFFTRATGKIPIVTITADPIALGLITNMARPGGNITGVSIDTGPAIHGKRLGLLREMFPAMSKLACLVPSVLQWDGIIGPALRTASEQAGVPLVRVFVEFPASAAGYRDAIAEASRQGANAIMVLDSPDIVPNRAVIVELIAAARLPAIYGLFELVEAGGLMAYSFDLADLTKQAAHNIDAILRGAYPGDIPFYQNTRYELSINLKTANALGLTVPPTLLAVAEKVVE
jgi:putative tryptophan/tyrosine transport system substrate-binding protein